MPPFLRLFRETATFQLPLTTRWGYRGPIIILNPRVPTGARDETRCREGDWFSSLTSNTPHSTAKTYVSKLEIDVFMWSTLDNGSAGQDVFVRHHHTKEYLQWYFISMVEPCEQLLVNPGCTTVNK